MIERYSRPEMANLWSQQRHFQRWLDVELAAMEAMVEAGIVPAEAAATARELAKVHPARIAEIEAEVRHDVIAFVTSIEEQIGAAGRWLHYGMTSSDVLDTALALALTEAGDLLLAGGDRLADALRALALEYRHTPMIGRSHGIHAEPTTFGLVALGWHQEVMRAVERMRVARASVAFGKISGAVGTFSHLSPEIEARAMRKLGLEPEPVSTQVVPRDRHAEYFHAVSLLGAAVERISTQIRLLARTEVMEALEPFGKGQRGSSAMPHKRNPILCENLCGLARLLRSYLIAAQEDIALWHERDISHSSVERVISPDATILLDFMLHRLSGVIEGLDVRPERMRENLDASGGTVFSGAVLLALVRKGLGRQEAYGLVQRAALAAAGGAGDFQALLAADPDVGNQLDAEEVAACFDLRRHLRHTDAIFARVLEESP